MPAQPLHTAVMSGGSGTAGLLAQLRDDLGYRRIGQGIRRLESVRPALEALEPGGKDSGVLVGLLAQWVDAGFDGLEALRRLVAGFPVSVRTDLPLLDYLHLRMAEGMLAMSEEDLGRAAEHFRFVQSLEGEVSDAELLAIANFWTGRCLRKTGRYDDAENYRPRRGTGALLRLPPDGGHHADRAKLAGLPAGQAPRRAGHSAPRRGGPGRDGRLPEPGKHPVGLRPDRPPAGPLPGGAGSLRASHRRVPPGGRRAVAVRPGADEPGLRPAPAGPRDAEGMGPPVYVPPLRQRGGRANRARAAPGHRAPAPRCRGSPGGSHGPLRRAPQSPRHRGGAYQPGVPAPGFRRPGVRRGRERRGLPARQRKERLPGDGAGAHTAMQRGERRPGRTDRRFRAAPGGGRGLRP